MDKTLKGIAIGACAASMVVMSGGVLAQARYPDKPVKVIVGYAPGGLPDTVARLTAQRLSERWGQQVLVENRASANGILAAELIAKSPADGYSLLVTDSSTTAVNPFIYQKLPYSPNDLMPVSLLAKAPLFLAVHNSVPVNTFGELVAMARAQPGKMTYGSSGIGSTHHLSMEFIKSVLSLDIVHVPFKGTGQSVPALISGQVPMVFSAYPSLASHAKAGTVKLIAANSARRSALAPTVPTVAESGVAGFDFAPPIGILAPAAMAKDLAARISADAAAAVRVPEVTEKMAGVGIEAVGGTPEEYAAQLKADAERYARAIKAAGMKAE
jgi:tripartite-type tricarboxylate transporter receptor subunit TctC